ncbi:hypothetical protein C9374_010998 [Naegleria lovaniensis]|uniref:CCT-theta n=1 Tax=Naegleria lovaniensis TaxID=51637 RepID=A0AA88GHE1_NAELO|nr:uncharacterized protein C9374_010998 [Naegleria lovaniensis]KAG2374161.1 hypothetical protein C9374_010998 [Naegleria lovaniensis]
MSKGASLNFKQHDLTSYLKSGSTHYSGLNAVTLRNIEACQNLSKIVRTSMGPNGMNKIVVNHLEKLFISKDTATILKELEVIHPAAKIVVLATQAQEQEAGDGTNFVACFTGELLAQSENLIRMGLHIPDIILGYKKAGLKALEILETLGVDKVTDIRNVEQVTRAIRSAVGSKVLGMDDFLAPLIAEACVAVCPKVATRFSVENIRTAKIPGGSVFDSKVLKGFAFVRDSEGSIKHAKHCKVAVYTCNIEQASTETKNSVVIRSSEELLNYNVSEEKAMEEEIKAIHDTGVKVIVSQGGFGEMALHFIEQYGMMAIKCPSKFQIQRLCQAIGAKMLVKVQPPTADDMGTCASVDITEIGDKKVAVFQQAEDVDISGITTIIIRGATQNVMDEVERAVDDGVNAFKSLTKDDRLLAGAGACEVELYSQLSKYADETPGLEQYAIRKCAEAFLVVPRTLSESAGLDSSVAISNLTAAHAEGKSTWGIDVHSVTGLDAKESDIFDLFNTKYWGIKLSTDAAVNILSVDQIIMARPAGGPVGKNPNPTHWDEQGEGL